MDPWLVEALTYVLFLASPTIVALVVLAVLFLPKFRLGTVAGSPQDVLAYLAHQLRLSLHRVDTTRNQLSIRVDSSVMVKLHARQTDHTCEILYQADATPGTWGLIVFLFIFALYYPLALINIPMVIYIFLKSRRFARRDVRALLPTHGVRVEPPGADNIRAILVDSLSESYRLASEAFEAKVALYQDAQFTTSGFGGLLVWLVLFLSFSLSPPGPYLSSRVVDALVWATAGAIGFIILCFWFVRHRYSPQIQMYREWADHLRVSLMREVSRENGADVAQSAFETLAEASRRVPDWVSIPRQTWMGSDAVWFYVLLGAGVWGAGLLLLGLQVALTGEPGLSILPLMAGIGLLAGVWFTYRSIRRRRSVEARQALERWNVGFEAVRSQMERFLREL